jgi:hypothetical protein
MKNIFIFLMLCIAQQAVSQTMAYITDVQATEKNALLIKVELIFRTNDRVALPITLGAQWLFVSQERLPVTAEITHSRIWCYEGRVIQTTEDQYFQIVPVYHDNSTIDPRDDHFLGSVTFEVEKQVARWQEPYYGSIFQADEVSRVPLGESLVKTGSVSLTPVQNEKE